MVKSRCVISMLLAKLDIINAELSMKYDRNIIVQTSGRIKAPESIRAKLRKKDMKKPMTWPRKKSTILWVSVPYAPLWMIYILWQKRWSSTGMCVQ